MEKNKLPKGIKPIPQCQTVGEVMASLSNLCKELNEIPGVKARVALPQINKANGG